MHCVTKNKCSILLTEFLEHHKGDFIEIMTRLNRHHNRTKRVSKQLVPTATKIYPSSRSALLKFKIIQNMSISVTIFLSNTNVQ